MRSTRSMFIAGGCLLAVMILLGLLWLRHKPDPSAETPSPVVSTVAAHQGYIANQLTVPGVFQPFQEIDVHGKVSGYVRHIYVDIGDRVHEGQTLAVLEVPELDAQVAGAQAGIHQNEENIDRLRNEVAREQASSAAVQASDQQPGLVAAQELEDALAHDQSTTAQVDAAKSAVAAAQGQLGISHAESLRVNSMAHYAIITAPYDGVITMRYADTGSLVPAGTSEGLSQAVVRLAQSNVLRLRMPVPEREVPMVHIGSTVSVKIQATGQQFPGTVVRFTRDVSNATRTMLTEVDVKNPDLKLTPGMYAEVAFNLQEKKDALLVPSNAIIEGDQPAVLLVDKNNRIERRSVTLGIAGSNSQEVIAGLSPGDQVVVGGLARLQPGQQVTPHPAPSDLVNYAEKNRKGDE
jgi:RND family efflux transporter MFP subunit